jgi:hypothetical protein
MKTISFKLPVAEVMKIVEAKKKLARKKKKKKKLEETAVQGDSRTAIKLEMISKLVSNAGIYTKLPSMKRKAIPLVQDVINKLQLVLSELQAAGMYEGIEDSETVDQWKDPV